MHLRIPNPVQACLEEAQAPVPQTASSPTLCANGPPIPYKLARPTTYVWAHPSVEGEPIEVTDPPKETRGVHNQLQNVHTGG